MLVPLFIMLYIEGGYIMKVENFTYYDYSEIVDGFNVKPGFFSFTLYGIRYFSSGYITQENLWCYVWDSDSQTYKEDTICVIDIPEIWEKWGKGIDWDLFVFDHNLDIKLSDFSAYTDCQKKSVLKAALSFEKYGLTDAEQEYISDILLQKKITPRIKAIAEPEYFSNYLTEVKWEDEDYSGFCEGHQEVTVICGKVVPGYDSDKEDINMPPKFDPKKRAAVLVHEHERTTGYALNSCSGKDSNTLVIYNPMRS